MPPKFDPSEVKVGEYIYLILLYVYAIDVYSISFINERARYISSNAGHGLLG